MDQEKFTSLVQRASGRMYGYAYRILRNQQEAEDIVQEVFLKLWKMKTKLDEYSSVEALAITMIRNQCIDLLRKPKMEHDTDISKMLFNVSGELSPYDTMVNRENGRMLKEIIDRLPEQLRTLVRMHDMDGIPYEEIAVKEGLNINTIRVSISRARKLIRDEFTSNKYGNRRD